MSGNRKQDQVKPDCGDEAKAESHAHRETTVTAPVLDSTPGYINYDYINYDFPHEGTHPATVQSGRRGMTFTTASFGQSVRLTGTVGTSTLCAIASQLGRSMLWKCRIRLVIKNYDKVGPSARQMADDFVDLIHELATEGCPVEVRAESE